MLLNAIRVTHQCNLIHIHLVANDTIKEDSNEYLGVNYAKKSTASVSL